MVFKIIIKIPAALRRDDETRRDHQMQSTTTTRGTLYVPKKRRSERKWKKSKMITKKRRRIAIPEAALREKLERIRYARDYSFLFSTEDDDNLNHEPILVPIKDSKEASKSNVDTSCEKLGMKETLIDVLSSIAERKEHNENFKRRTEENRRLKMIRSCMLRRPKASLG